MTEIGMRVARALGKRNLTNDKMSLETIASVVDEVAQLPILYDIMCQLTGSEVIDMITAEAAKRAMTF